MNLVMNLEKPVTWLGPKDAAGYVWGWQDGRIYGWSDSNCWYEQAWWLDETGKPIEGKTANAVNHIKAICQDRPFDPQWLQAIAKPERADGTGKV